MSLAQFDRWFRRNGCERAEGLPLPAEHRGRRAYYLPVAGETKAAAGTEAELVKRVVLTTPTRDRHGDIILPTGVRLEGFLKNPVVLWAHRYDLPPIGVVDAASLQVTDRGIEANIVFDGGGVLGREVYGLYDRGVMRAWSIGFIPLQWELIEDPETGKATGYRVTAWELLELSAVPVPANPETLTRAVKDYESRGYDPQLLPVVKDLKAAANGMGRDDGPDRGRAAASEPLRGADAERRQARRPDLDALSTTVLARLSAEVERLVEREFGRRRGAVQAADKN